LEDAALAGGDVGELPAHALHGAVEAIELVVGVLDVDLKARDLFGQARLALCFALQGGDPFGLAAEGSRRTSRRKR